MLPAVLIIITIMDRVRVKVNSIFEEAYFLKINFKENILNSIKFYSSLFSPINFVMAILNSTDSTNANSQRLPQTQQTEKPFSAFKTNSSVSGNSSKANINTILQSYTTNSILMKNSMSGSEKDSMSENSDDESDVDVDIIGDGMLC